jgi:putative nucleotidyltransferase with HDIG domain
MNHRTPPRLVSRTTVFTFAVVACVLSAVFIAVTLNQREYVRASVVEQLEAGQRMLSALEHRRARELSAQVATLAENPTLKAAMDTYRSELKAGDPVSRRELLATIEKELTKVADRTQPDVLAVRSSAGELLAAAGSHKNEWTSDAAHLRAGVSDEFVTLPSGVFRVAWATIAFQDVELGRLELATALDQMYAKELSVLSGASMIIASNRSIVASTLPKNVTASLSPEQLAQLPVSSIIRLGHESYATQLLFRAGDAAVFAFDSIDASAGPAMADAIQSVLLIALGAFALAGAASFAMARMLSKPIDTLSRSLSAMTRSRSFEQPLPLAGTSQEIDALTQSFNTMMRSVVAAEAETQSAYVGAIRALATALDARDPYTAGHSERVSAISVAVGREMGLDDDQLEVLRLGALLHDIGKIGVSDHVLRKPGSLTAEEFELIKQHPGLGARILRSVPFLARHVPIVELHHERPDGKGYPHGLAGHEIPLLARIAHVADAFDAITSARAYRPARPAGEALAELWACAGAQFDAEAVHALARAVPQLSVAPVSPDADVLLVGAQRRMSLVTRY